MYRKLIGSFGLILATTLFVAAQAPSPFSGVGIGQLSSNGLVQHNGTGGVGVGMGSYWNLNSINPALLTYSKGTLFGGLTVFQSGVTYENRSIRNQTDNEVSVGTNMAYISMGFPIISNKWYSSIGLRPYSTVNYNLNYVTPVVGSPYNAKISESGSGGINQLFWSNGVQVNKNISVGLKSQLIFSSIFNETTSQLDTDEVPVAFASTIFERTTPAGLIFTGGLVYSDSILRGDKNPLRYTVGLTYDFKREIRAKQFVSIERRLLSGTIWESDTVRNNVIGTLSMPSGFGVGFSIANGFKWTVGADIRVSNFADFRKFDEYVNTQDTFFAGFGIDLTPDAFSIDEYLKRVTYRFGASYETTAYLINGKGVRDFGINFGMSLPIVPSATAGAVVNKGLSSVDFGFRYGIQGSLADNLLEEEYFRIHFGVTFNDKWFVKRKFN